MVHCCGLQGSRGTRQRDYYHSRGQRVDAGGMKQGGWMG